MAKAVRPVYTGAIVAYYVNRDGSRRTLEITAKNEKLTDCTCKRLADSLAGKTIKKELEKIGVTRYRLKDVIPLLAAAH